MAITLTQLTAFLAVVNGGSVTAAADELIVTQPPVSAAIAALARELGCDLFERAAALVPGALGGWPGPGARARVRRVRTRGRGAPRGR
jgi:hypothetical protein